MNSKIVIAVLAFVCAVEYVLAGIDLSAEQFEKCGKENNVDLETIQKFNHTRPIETDNKDIKCYLKCVLMEYKWLTEDGKLQMGEWGDADTQKAYKEAVDSCMTISGDDLCEIAYRFHKCVIEHKEAH